MIRSDRRSAVSARLARKLIDYYADGGEIRFFNTLRTWRISLSMAKHMHGSRNEFYAAAA